MKKKEKENGNENKNGESKELSTQNELRKSERTQHTERER